MSALALAGCAKKEEPPAPPPPKPTAMDVVEPAERSAHFLAVSRELELGGTLFGYVDIDGDALKLAGTLHETFTQLAKTQPQLAPVAKQDFAALFRTLGLTDVKAIGFSSVPDGTGYFRNRAFLYLPEGRHGLLAGLGEQAAPFARLNLAPADTDLYGETEIDLRVVYQTVRQVVAQVAGEPAARQFESTLGSAGAPAALAVLDLINGLKGRAALVARIDPEKNVRLPGPAGVTVPAFSLLLSVDGIGGAVEPALKKSPAFTASAAGTLRLYEVGGPAPMEGLRPVIAIDGSTLLFATSRAFLDECRGPKAGLAETPAFKAALARVGAEGNGLSYASPRLFTRFHQLESLNPNLPEQVRALLRLSLSGLATPDRPLVTLRINRPDGILVRSYWNRSMKQDLAMVAVYNPVTVGVLAAMAIPAFQKVRASSQEKAVLNNLRQFSAAGDQFCLEHGVAAADYNDLVGPDKYIRALTPVAGEEYRTLRYVPGEPLRIELADGRVVESAP